MKRHTIVALAIGGVVVCLWAVSGMLLYHLPERGTIGDMFGAVNALFSGLAFVGILYALLLQHEELEQAKAEFSRSAQAQREAAQLQALTLLFQEYKQLLEEKHQEITRVAGSSLAHSSGFFDTLRKERDVILGKKYQVDLPARLRIFVNNPRDQEFAGEFEGCYEGGATIIKANDDLWELCFDDYFLNTHHEYLWNLNLWHKIFTAIEPFLSELLDADIFFTREDQFND